MVEPTVLWEDRGDGYVCIWRQLIDEAIMADEEFRLELWIANRGERSPTSLGGWDIDLVDAATGQTPDTGVWVPAAACEALLAGLQRFAAERPTGPHETAASHRIATPRQPLSGEKQS